MPFEANPAPRSRHRPFSTQPNALEGRACAGWRQASVQHQNGIRYQSRATRAKSALNRAVTLHGLVRISNCAVQSQTAKFARCRGLSTKRSANVTQVRHRCNGHLPANPLKAVHSKRPQTICKNLDGVPPAILHMSRTNYERGFWKGIIGECQSQIQLDPMSFTMFCFLGVTLITPFLGS